MRALTPQFTWIPLGAGGGLLEDNLSAHLIAPIGSHDFICLDAGTLSAGLKAANNAGCFYDIPIPEDSNLSTEGQILHCHIRAYLISHPYLDHTQGLVASSPNDTPKPILSLEGVISDIRSHIFNWRTWPNFGDAGEPPCLGLYRYLALLPGVRTPIENTEMHVQAFPLSHGTHTDSVAFLVESNGYYVLYMGDTGPDEIENRTTTADLWRQITPLIQRKCLQAIFIESSYVDERSDSELYSHLTPAWVIRAFNQLASMVDAKRPKAALEGLTVIITHIKPDLLSGKNPRQIVKEQFKAHNDLGLRLIFAEQGNRLDI
ncbi:MBL fold metallo-hydrolase [Thermodesulfobacteriota bacterium]